ncbi:hypothetical protein PseudUWO311_16005 [Pseudanabaena sp. UWO311]|uniref:hypothetical protein n=1 Tax=Pseudanabaena sp. UWO311 TaxID=2487337 RepID=UPI0011578F18|nr:hypothetical protein [Pseudanabaena sp. UWO311]TYQ25311.1 hypothetical protein PseudUWO311_16005 [Pseudanabaena sp. UWO311]
MRSLKSLKSLTIVSSLICLIAIAACSSPTPETKPAPPNPIQTSANPSASTKATAPKSSDKNSDQASDKPNDKTSENHGKANQGGQVVEVGAYHLELVSINEDGGVHIDLFLQNGSDHSPIPDAKVSAQVQLPNGTKKSLDMPYKADGKHYGALLSETIAGEYKVVILSEIKGEKINGRFAFKR